MKDRCGRVNGILADLKDLLKPWPEKGLGITSQYAHTVVFGELNFRVVRCRGGAVTVACSSRTFSVHCDAARELRL